MSRINYPTGTNVRSYSTKYEPSDLMLPAEYSILPPRCYSCGKVLIQDTIEKGLKEGKSMGQIMDELQYQRLCCRRSIMENIRLNWLQEKLHEEEQQRAAEYRVPFLERPPIHIPVVFNPVLEPEISEGISNLNLNTEPVNTFEYYMSQLN